MHVRWLLAALFVASIPASALTLDAPDMVDPIPPGGSTDVAIAVTADCLQDILQGTIAGTGSYAATVTASDPPAWLNATEATVDFSITDCGEGGATTVTKNATVTLSAGAGAPGLTKADVVFASGEVTDTLTGVFVGYRSGHTITPAGDQTFEVDGDTLDFFVNITVSANAMTMVMFEDQKTTGAGTVTGLGLRTFDVNAGQTSASLPITFTAPEGSWDNVTFKFRNFSHCMQAPTGYDCSPTNEANITWTFMNAGGSSNGGDGKDSPGLGVVFGLLAVVAVALRRK